MIVLSRVLCIAALLQISILLWAVCVSAESGYLAHGDGEGFKCAGVYKSSEKDESKRSAIEIEIPSIPPADIAIAIFDYPDSRWVGIPVKDGTKIPDEQVDMPETYANSNRDPENGNNDAGVQRFVVCSNETIAMGLCTEVDRGRPLINDRDNKGNPRSFNSVIYSDYIMLKRTGPGYTRLEYKAWLAKNNNTDNHDVSWRSKSRVTMLDSAALQWLADGTLKIRYLVRTTGFYCVDAASLGDFTASVHWINSHGLLPASEYPKMYVYFLLMLAYVSIAIAWGIMSWRVWSEILPVQNQLFGLVCLLAVDMGMNFGFWKYYNANGSPSMVFSIFTLVIDAGRNSLSFFMLLVVSLGWGVVRPSLGKTMIRCILLAMIHFSAGCLYGAGLLFRDPHESGPLGLIYVIPLSVSMTLFYVWTLSAIISTTHLLIERQQSYKLAMYNNLWRLLLVCLVLLFAFFILNILHTIFYSHIRVAARSWKWLWFWTDGWLNFEYFVALCIILYWWRPTTQNYRYSLEEIAGDEDEAMERELATTGHDSFDGPRMGEDLELDEITAANTKANRPVSISGDAVQFVINEDDLEFSSDDDVGENSNANAHNQQHPPHSSTT
ncbi:hypothetical protein GGI25_001783 [Coemansia spiralis]|uniref:GOST seven transmembrane domain-containing protein n=2 Tax=Coemansia TaxID=4863 RepID=A0A9W8GBR0_9FUNG|nr:lung seven transmembrane receptor-domain-containing protein [Coemansia spiralis]KAJ1994011.1 hypothetical protein EDC05_001922 [Coemansia umbellata]KAJ2618724.1 hypothetical protein GGI26_006399 [Coemansia sp. RSA 1358]KAJ2679011.1 hypothetical protein GGI25_001783 [Coemansia spiralis]